MLLYKFLPTVELAEQVSISVFRFYELVKNIKLASDAYTKIWKSASSVIRGGFGSEGIPMNQP